MPADYIKAMRKLIGNRELLSVGLGVLIQDQQSRILFEKRTDNGLYCFPGGSIDLGEKLEEAARRETKEEVGLELNDLTLFLITSGEQGRLEYPNGDVTYYVTFYYSSTPKEGSIPAIGDGESSELVWLSWDEIPEESRLLPGTKKALEAFQGYQGFPIVD